MVTFTLPPNYPWGMGLFYPLNKKLGRLHSRYGLFKSRKNVWTLPGFKP